MPEYRLLSLPAAILALVFALGTQAAALRSRDLVVADFDHPGAHGTWTVEHDDNHLGTLLLPDPFAPEPAGPSEPRACGHIHGHLGLNQAPWTWAQLRLNVLPSGGAMDLGKYRSVRFWAKGDGKTYQIRLMKKSVTDSDEFGMSFATGPQWRLVELPLSAFRQSGWGHALGRDFSDVYAVDFNPLAHDADFDVSVAGVVFSPSDARLKPRPYDTRGWWVYPGVDPKARQGSPLDASFLQDAPAGRHGRVETRGEDFVFRDGHAVRFFGVNLVASCNFPNHAQADAMADLLSEMGVNLTRHHHLEAPWSDRNIFGGTAGTRRLDPVAMERFDYLVAALQKKGIYQTFDLLVSRPPLAADGVADPSNLVNGWKIMAEFAPDLLPLEEDFIGQFLGHRNQYTGRRYADDPAVAMMEVINEDSLFYRGSSGDFAVKGTVYSKAFQDRFNAWLRSHYKNRADLARAWAPSVVAQRGLGDDEDPWASTTRPIASWQDDSWKTLSPARARDEERFNYDTQTGYYRTIIGDLRRLGYRGLVTGSNHWTSSPADLLANASLGTYIDRHAYFAHPQGGWGYDPAVRFDPSPMLRTGGIGIVGALAAHRVSGLPYIVTEWQCAAPNDTRADAVLDMALACDLQNWSAVQFAFRHSSLEDLIHFGGPLDNNFDVANQPAMLALWPAAAILARRGDVAKLGPTAWTYLSPAAALEPGAVLGTPGRMALTAECGVDFGLAPVGLSVTAAPEGTWTVGGGGAVRHDPARGLLLIDSPGTQAVAGFSRGVAEHPSRLRVRLANDYAVVVVTALDTANVASARKLLLTAVANAVNKGMSLEPAGDQLAAKGGPEVLVEPVVGTVLLSVPATQGARVWALDPSGRRRRAVRVELVAGGLAFDLRASDRAMNYEIDLPDARVGGL